MKRALVTGGSGDIGRAICQRLARDGLHVIVHARQHPERAAVAVDAIRAAGGSAEAVAFDVADEAQTRRMLTELLEAGPIQVLVNNAGVHDDAPMAGMSSMQWRQPIEVCLHGFFNVTQPLLLPMLGTRWGRIINISSLAGVTGNRGQTNYAAAKAGLHGATGRWRWNWPRAESPSTPSRRASSPGRPPKRRSTRRRSRPWCRCGGRERRTKSPIWSVFWRPRKQVT